MVSLPLLFILKVLEAVKARILPAVVEVRLKKVMAGVFAPSKVDVPAPSIVTVPLFGVNPPLVVLLSVKFPARVNEALVEAENTPLVDIVIEPFKLKALSFEVSLS